MRGARVLQRPVPFLVRALATRCGVSRCDRSKLPSARAGCKFPATAGARSIFALIYSRRDRSSVHATKVQSCKCRTRQRNVLSSSNLLTAKPVYTRPRFYAKCHRKPRSCITATTMRRNRRRAIDFAHPIYMGQPPDETRTAKQLGILGVPVEKLYALRKIFGDEDCPLPLYGSNETTATHGWFPVKSVDDDNAR